MLSQQPLEAKAYRFDGHPVRVVSAPAREVTQRISAEPTPAETLVATLPAILAESTESEERTIVRLPLRWYPSAASPGITAPPRTAMDIILYQERFILSRTQVDRFSFPGPIVNQLELISVLEPVNLEVVDGGGRQRPRLRRTARGHARQRGPGRRTPSGRI